MHLNLGLRVNSYTTGRARIRGVRVSAGSQAPLCLSSCICQVELILELSLTEQSLTEQSLTEQSLQGHDYPHTTLIATQTSGEAA